MRVNAVHSVVFSPCGGTLQVARALVSGPLPGGEIYDLTRPAERRSLDFGPEDLVFFCFPVYAGLVPDLSETVLKTVTGRRTPAVLAAVYGNREFEGALKDLESLVVRRGFHPVAAAAAVAEHSLEPAVAAGRPDENDRAALADFGRKIHQRLAAQPDLESFPFQAPGAYPDRERSGALSPSADPELCTACGLCVPACPAGAIDEAAPETTAETCIGCMACVKVCPERARALRHPELPKLLAWLKSVASERREPSFFF